MAQFRKLREERKHEDRQETYKAARPRKLHHMEEIPFDPAGAQRAHSAPFCALREDHGFVFSTAKMDSHIQRESRLQEAHNMAA